jgi:hypothetical protein
MSLAREVSALLNPFAATKRRFERLLDDLGGAEYEGTSHADAERRLWSDGMELLRRTYQDRLDTQGQGDVGPELEGSDNVLRKVGRLHPRQLESLFGEVEVGR